ncbi:MAG: sensor histidine kinase [Terriglobia bacterium]
MKIFLICQQPQIATALKAFSDEFGHSVTVCSEVSEEGGTLKGQSWEAGLIVLEMNPNAAEWLPQIKDYRRRNLAVTLAVIGDGSDEQTAEALSLGAEAYFTVPLRPKLLQMTLIPLLNNTQLRSLANAAQDQAARVQRELYGSLERQQEAITEKELTYRELLLAYAQLQELNQQKNNFLASATHELRTPVTVMKGYHRILLDGRLGELAPQQREVLLESEQSCARLIKIINSLLDLSRIETGKLELFYQDYDLAANLKQVVKQMKELSKRKGLSVVVKLEKNLPSLRCDREKINQVVTNLLENAIKYTQAGGKIYISAGPYFWDKNSGTGLNRVDLRVPSPNPANAVVLQVSDNGIGISPEHHQEIFDQFTQVPSNQMDRSGLGLGLAITKRIIEAHGGRIWVDSQVNSGSRFTFLMPLAPLETPATAALYSQRLGT